MGHLFGMECDLCGKRQISKNPLDIKGRTYVEGEQQKFACPDCDLAMKAAFEVKRKGLRKPLIAMGKVLKERDFARRERDAAMAELAGEKTIGALRMDPKYVSGLPAPVPGMHPLLGYAHNEFRLVKVVRLARRVIAVVDARGNETGTFYVRCGPKVLASAELFRARLRKVSGGKLGNSELPQKAWQEMLSAAPVEDKRAVGE